MPQGFEESKELSGDVEEGKDKKKTYDVVKASFKPKESLLDKAREAVSKERYDQSEATEHITGDLKARLSRGEKVGFSIDMDWTMFDPTKVKYPTETWVLPPGWAQIIKNLPKLNQKLNQRYEGAAIELSINTGRSPEHIDLYFKQAEAATDQRDSLFLYAEYGVKRRRPYEDWAFTSPELTVYERPAQEVRGAIKHKIKENQKLRELIEQEIILEIATEDKSLGIVVLYGQGIFDMRKHIESATKYKEGIDAEKTYDEVYGHLRRILNDAVNEYNNQTRHAFKAKLKDSKIRGFEVLMDTVETNRTLKQHFDQFFEKHPGTSSEEAEKVLMQYFSQYLTDTTKPVIRQYLKEQPEKQGMQISVPDIKANKGEGVKDFAKEQELSKIYGLGDEDTDIEMIKKAQFLVEVNGFINDKKLNDKPITVDFIRKIEQNYKDKRGIDLELTESDVEMVIKTREEFIKAFKGSLFSGPETKLQDYALLAVARSSSTKDKMKPDERDAQEKVENTVFHAATTKFDGVDKALACVQTVFTNIEEWINDSDSPKS